MSNDADYFIRQFEVVLAMARRLAPLNIAIYELDLCESFGHWAIVAGKRGERVKFLWEGRDRVLTIRRSIFFSESEVSKLERPLVKDMQLASSEDALEEVEKFLMQKFAA